MRYLRIAGLCLVAVFALGAIASASASAEPPAIYECHKLTKSKVTKKYEGQYEKGCVTKNTKGEGEYELQEWNLEAKKGKAKEFKGKGGGANLEIIGLAGVECAKSSDKGKFTSAKTAGEIVVTFTGCKYQGKNCSTAGSASGEIKTNKLVAVVGYLEGKGGPSPKMGVRLSPETGTEYVEFSCLPLYFRVTHEGAGEFAVNNFGVIGEIVLSKKGGYPINKFSKELALNFQQSSGKQRWTSFEGAGEHDSLITQDQPSEFKGVGGEATKSQSAEQTLSEGKGEELELKA
jgi:hypothetical protein